MIFLLIGVMIIWLELDYSYYGIDWGFIAWGAVLVLIALGAMIYLMIKPLKKMINNSSRRPTVTVKGDGTFVLYHLTGREHLTDKVIDVHADGGTVSFILSSENGNRYEKKVRYVENSSFTVSRIKDVLSLKDSRYSLTQYENMRIFCQFCGSRIGTADKACSHCGGKVMR
jgi:DNA-directed RNA polymerase subunit RPC12/RpoP